MSKMVRLSVDFSPEVYDLMSQLAEETHTTKSDLLRKAIALIEVAVHAKQRGEKLGLMDKDRNVVTEIVGLP